MHFGHAFSKALYPRDWWATGATTIGGYTIPLVEHKAYTSKIRLEIVFSKAFDKGLK